MAHVGRHHLHHVVTHLAAIVELERGDANAFLPDLRRRGIVGAVGGAADVVLVRPVDRPEGEPLADEHGQQHGEIGQVIVAVIRVVEEEHVARLDAALEEVGDGRDRPGQGAHVDRHVLGLGRESPLAVEDRRREIAARVEDLGVGRSQHGLAHLLDDAFEPMLDHRDRDAVGIHARTIHAKIVTVHSRPRRP